MSSEISPNFKTVACNEYCLRVADGTHDSPKEAKIGKLLVTSKNVKGGRLLLDSAYLISEEDFNEINRRSKVDQWDILLTMIGTVGEVCIVEQANPSFAIKNVGLLKCGSELRAKWLYYFLRSPQGQSLIEQRKKGSTQQYISLTEIRNFPVSYPDDEMEMRDAVFMLAALDDRITLLRETNATLEAIAQALFKSWFVDFDPVRAKMKGRTPEGMDEATAALFPDAFEETELGPVPRGWVAGTFGDVLAEYSKRIGTSQAIVLSAVQTGELVRSDEHFNKRVHSENIDKYKAVPPNAFAYNPSRINIGSIGLNELGSLGAVSPVYVVAKALSKSGAYLVWHHLRTERVRNAIATLATGTVRQSLSYSDFSSISLVIPAEKLMDIFLGFRSILFERIFAIGEKCMLLEEIRDSLLPRLISGN